MLLLRVELKRPPHARRNVPQVTQARRQVADLDVGVWPLATLDALQKVPVVRPAIGPPAHFLAWLVARPKQFPPFRLPQHEHPLGPVERIAVLVTFLDVRRPNTLLENQLLRPAANPCVR